MVTNELFESISTKYYVSATYIENFKSVRNECFKNPVVFDPVQLQLKNDNFYLLLGFDNYNK